MKNQSTGSPVKTNITTVAVAEKVNEPLFMYGTVTKGKGNKKTTHRAVVAGYRVSPTSIRIGISVCSTKDKFIKAKGRVIALGRAKSTNELHEVLYLTDDTTPVKQFIARAVKLVTPNPKKNSKSELELTQLN